MVFHMQECLFPCNVDSSVFHAVNNIAVFYCYQSMGYDD